MIIQVLNSKLGITLRVLRYVYLRITRNVIPSLFYFFTIYFHERLRRGGGGAWIFIHGTNIADRGLKGLFFGLFCYFSVFFPFPLPPGRG